MRTSSRLHLATVIIYLLAISVASAEPWKTYSDVTPQAQDNAVLYLVAIAIQWLLLALVWWGSMRGSELTLRALVAGPKRTWKTVAIDGAIAAGLLIVWTLLEPILVRALGSEGWGYTAAITPHGALEYGLWIVLSLSAAFCEEIVFRGYLLEQFRRRTHSVAIAILLQAVLFGVSHGYQGAKHMAVISVLGALYGLVAYRRGSLAPGMLFHAWADIVSVVP